MKFKIIILIFLFIVSSYPQGVHRTFIVKNSAGNNEFYITGTQSDTSEIFRTFEIMSVQYWAADTSGNDSVGTNIKFQVNPDTSLDSYFNGWEDSKTIISNFTSDSTSGSSMITSTPIRNFQWGRYVVTGTSNNRKLSATKVVIKHDNYESSRRW